MVNVSAPLISSSMKAIMLDYNIGRYNMKKTFTEFKATLFADDYAVLHSMHTNWDTWEYVYASEKGALHVTKLLCDAVHYVYGTKPEMIDVIESMALCNELGTGQRCTDRVEYDLGLFRKEMATRRELMDISDSLYAAQERYDDGDPYAETDTTALQAYYDTVEAENDNLRHMTQLHCKRNGQDRRWAVGVE